MIQDITIRNYKSIDELSFKTKKLNVFIGEPNAGKSNIIEALTLRSDLVNRSNKLSKDIFRFNSVSELFYDFNINVPIEILCDKEQTLLKYAIREDNGPENVFHLSSTSSSTSGNRPATISHDGTIQQQSLFMDSFVRFYEFRRLNNFIMGYTPYLSQPNGDNLPGLLLANPALKDWAADFLKGQGFTLTLKPVENDINISKLVNNSIYSYPYFSLSETFQRIIFYNLAIRSNHNAVLLFDEPESNTFPFYTKHLAETIALDETNQFFISTHNPYMLLSLIEKSKESSIAVFIVKMQEYKTSLQELNSKQLQRVLDFNSDVFFNFEAVLEK